jgi:ABC-type glycerol-3-phosphate transport system permease component
MTTTAKASIAAKTKSREYTYKLGKFLTEVAKYALLIPLALSFIFPIYWMFTSALKDDPQVFTIPPVLIPNPAYWENFIAGWEC